MMFQHEYFLIHLSPRRDNDYPPLIFQESATPVPSKPVAAWILVPSPRRQRWNSLGSCATQAETLDVGFSGDYSNIYWSYYLKSH